MAVYKGDGSHLLCHVMTKAEVKFFMEILNL